MLKVRLSYNAEKGYVDAQNRTVISRTAMLLWPQILTDDAEPLCMLLSNKEHSMPYGFRAIHFCGRITPDTWPDTLRTFSRCVSDVFADKTCVHMLNGRQILHYAESIVAAHKVLYHWRNPTTGEWQLAYPQWFNCACTQAMDPDAAVLHELRCHPNAYVFQVYVHVVTWTRAQELPDDAPETPISYDI